MPQLMLARRFAPMFWTMFLGALNDNFFRTALVFLVSFRIMADRPDDAALLAAVAPGLFILPFFLFSPVAGVLADIMDKAHLARLTKLAEVLIMLVAGYGLLIGNLPVLLVVLFATGLHSALFGPLKYAILPQHLERTELLAGNGWVEAGTFVAILLGQLLGGLVPPELAAPGLLLVAVAGLLATAFIPPAPSQLQPGQPRPSLGLLAAHRSVFGLLAADAGLRRTIICISWFWGAGGVLTSQFVPMVRNVLGADEQVATSLLALFSIGIGLGSWLANILLKGQISTRYAGHCALAMAAGLAGLLVVLLLAPTVMPDQVLAGPGAFLSRPAGQAAALSVLLIAVAAGCYIVPLYARMQVDALPEQRAQVIAANNVVNALFLTLMSAASAALLALGQTIAALIALLALGTLFFGWFASGLRHSTPSG